MQTQPRNVKARGVRVRCLGCGAIYRHHPGQGSRLRKKACGRCGSRCRPIWWCEKYPERFEREQRGAQFALALRDIGSADSH